MIEAGHAPTHGEDPGTWPWTWLRIVGYVKLIRSVYERAAYDNDPKTAIPPRWMFWDGDAVDDWFKERKR